MAWFRFEKCTIENVDFDPSDLGTITISLLNDELQEKLDEPYSVSFATWRDHKKELVELKSGLRERCYFTNGMQDIDVFVTGGKFAILHSPHEMENRVFVLDDGEYEKLLEAYTYKYGCANSKA
ncbi:hypothetical protein [Paenibacillus dendritiformis]|uniref:hypothetical protein n=1 Tax=Paenibacillus dendritiformis TaxID=130049 RepID=UPI00387E0BC5